MDPIIKKLHTSIEKAQKITVLTGAGISTESGVPDFRSQNGIYKAMGEEKVAYYLSATYLKKNPEDFWKKYNEIFTLKSIKQYEPNKGHSFLSKMEKWGKSVRIFTQNIDGLHQQAGSKNVTELHGNIYHAHCPTCNESYALSDILTMDVPRCKKDETILRPSIVLFGEAVKGIDKAIQSGYESDVFLVMGTSLEVYPVNEIPLHIPLTGSAEKYIINRVFTRMDRHFHHTIHQNIGTVMEQLETLFK